MPKNTLYLWDFANTLFPEKWNAALTGFQTFADYVRAQGISLNDPRGFEEAYKEPFINGEMINLKLTEGYQEVLTWAKHNKAFTSGVKEQLDWRAEYLNPQVGFDIRSFFQEINSTFDYGETNVKTKEMLVDYLGEKYAHGYRTVVYTDDKLANCQKFQQAAEEVKTARPDFTYRWYHILNDSQGLRVKDGYWEIGGLKDIIENEERIN